MKHAIDEAGHCIGCGDFKSGQACETGERVRIPSDPIGTEGRKVLRELPIVGEHLETLERLATGHVDAPMPLPATGLRDTGVRQTFSTGAVREPRRYRGAFHLVPGYITRRIARVWERGAVKYPANNWKNGVPLSRYLNSAQSHVADFLDGDRDEDHLGQAVWNLLCFMWTLREIRAGRLPIELDDLDEVAKEHWFEEPELEEKRMAELTRSTQTDLRGVDR